jgi:uncharacterized protein YndB with AHSA1/START domain
MGEQKSLTRGHDLSIEIDAPPEAVFRALTEAEEIVRWFAPEAKVTPGEGGSIWVSWGPGMSGTWLIEEWDPPRHVRFVEQPDGDYVMKREAHYAGTNTPVRIMLEYFLEGRGGRTVLRLVHSGFGTASSWDAEYDSTARGWVLFMRTLKSAVERHAGQPLRNVALELPLSSPLREVWRRLVGPGGFRAKAGGALAKGGAFVLGPADALVATGVVEIVAPPEADAGFGELAGTLVELDDALLWLTLINASGRHFAILMLIAHGVAPEQAERKGQEIKASIERLVSVAS